MLLRDWKLEYESIKKRDKKSIKRGRSVEGQHDESTARKLSQQRALDEFMKNVFAETNTLVEERMRIRDMQIREREPKIRRLTNEISNLKAEIDVLRTKKLKSIAMDSTRIAQEKQEFEAALRASNAKESRPIDFESVDILIKKWKESTNDTVMLSQELDQNLNRVLREQKELAKLRSERHMPSAVSSYLEQP